MTAPSLTSISICFSAPPAPMISMMAETGGNASANSLPTSRVSLPRPKPKVTMLSKTASNSATMGLPMLVVLVALTLARFAWVFGSNLVVEFCNVLGLKRYAPLGARASVVLSWAGVRGVVTLALALSVPEGFPGRDFILVTSFAVIVGTVLVQGTTLGRLIEWAKLIEPESEKARLNLSQAEAAMAQAQLATVKDRAYDTEGNLIHPRLLERYQLRAKVIVDYIQKTEHHDLLLHAHFDVVLAAIATGRRELIRLHRAGDIDDETLHELERDLDLEELSALSAKS